MNTEPPDWISGPPGPPRPPRPAWRSGPRLALAGFAAVALAVGGVAVAAAATSDSTPSPGASASPSPGSTAAPGRDRRERQPFLAGTVVSASGNTITITDFQGFQRTIHTSADTAYEDGLTATPAAGTRLYAVGTVDSDKTSLKATRVGALRDRPEGGPGRGFPGHWPGGRHHDRDRDGGPSTAPSPDGSATPSRGGSGTPSPDGSGTPSPDGSATSSPDGDSGTPGTPSPSPATPDPSGTA